MCIYMQEHNKLLGKDINEICILEKLHIKCKPSTIESCKKAHEALLPDFKVLPEDTENKKKTVIVKFSNKGEINENIFYPLNLNAKMLPTTQFNKVSKPKIIFL